MQRSPRHEARTFECTRHSGTFGANRRRRINRLQPEIGDLYLSRHQTFNVKRRRIGAVRRRPDLERVRNRRPAGIFRESLYAVRIAPAAVDHRQTGGCAPETLSADLGGKPVRTARGKTYLILPQRQSRLACGGTAQLHGRLPFRSAGRREYGIDANPPFGGKIPFRRPPAGTRRETPVAEDVLA